MAKSWALVALVACALRVCACEPSLDDLDRPLHGMATVGPTSDPDRGFVLATRTPIQLAPTDTPSPRPGIAPTKAITYVVQAGDTLALIARRFDASLERIAHASAITDVDVVAVGQVLTLPHTSSGGTGPAVAVPTMTQRVVGTRTPTLDLTATHPVTYVVQTGDTLGRIARSFDTTVDQIAQANSITNVDLIEVGQRLIVPQPWAGAVVTSVVAARPSVAAVTPTSVSPRMVAGRVVRVIDGDTIVVSIEGREHKVRYIGIDCPETVHPQKAVERMGPEASEANKKLVGGKRIYLEKDVSETDKYGRLLRYVWVGDVMVNAELVRLGYAQASTYPPDVKYQDLFLKMQREAREHGRGLWGEPPTATPAPAALPTAPPQAAANVNIAHIFYDGAVPKVESDEYCEIVNQGSAPVNLRGWRLNADDPGQDSAVGVRYIRPQPPSGLGTRDRRPSVCMCCQASPASSVIELHLVVGRLLTERTGIGPAATIPRNVSSSAR